MLVGVAENGFRVRGQNEVKCTALLSAEEYPQTYYVCPSVVRVAEAYISMVRR